MKYLLAYWYLITCKNIIPAKERLEIYQTVLEYYEKDTNDSPYVCDNLGDVVRLENSTKIGNLPYYMVFPEFILQKPLFPKVEKGIGWWDEDYVLPRINALNRAIKMCTKYNSL